VEVKSTTLVVQLTASKVDSVAEEFDDDRVWFGSLAPRFYDDRACFDRCSVDSTVSCAIRIW
jgi:hypothetical protein